MHKQLILFFLLTTVAFSMTIEEEIMLKYGSYISSSLLFIVLLLAFLFYWTFHYKKLAKNLKEELNVRNEALKTIQGRLQKNEVSGIQNIHELENKIVELQQKTKSLEDNLKEGLKSQVVTKIEEYQAKRATQIERLSIHG